MVKQRGPVFVFSSFFFLFNTLICTNAFRHGSLSLLNPLTRGIDLRFRQKKPPPASTVEDATDALARERGLEYALWKVFRGPRTNSNSEKVSKASQAKALLRKYGAAYLLTSITLAIISYTMCYSMISRGVDIVALLEKLGISTMVSAKAGNAAIAYAVHKAASPIRFPPTVALTPIVSGLLNRGAAHEKDVKDANTKL